MKRTWIIVLVLAIVFIGMFDLKNHSEAINWPNWELQQPDGTVTTGQRLKNTKSKYFRVSSEGWLILEDTSAGFTTKGSRHPRCELREMMQNNQKAAWDLQGSHVLTCNMSVKTNHQGRIVIGQIYNSTDSIPLIELGYSKENNKAGGNFSILYETAKGQGIITDISTAMENGQAFSYELSAQDGQIYVKLNDRIVYEKNITELDKKYYFKCGNYDQTAIQGNVAEDKISAVTIRKATVSHKV